MGRRTLRGCIGAEGFNGASRDWCRVDVWCQVSGASWPLEVEGSKKGDGDG
jgi:hypothetical protein